MARLGLVCACFALAACPKAPVGRGLDLTVELSEQVQSKCVTVSVSGGGSALVAKAVLPDPAQRVFKVAVLQGTLPDEVTVQAAGFADASCTTATSPAETSEVLTITFPPSGIRPVSLTLRRQSDIDADGDLSPQGVDCDDHDPLRTPGKDEVCSDHLDNDCNSLVDCADSACGSKACASNATAQQAACVGARCAELGCANSADDDVDGTVDCADADCEGQACPNGGTCALGVCTNAQSEVGLCGDGQDNDHDGQTDCFDLDCLGLRCDDHLACQQEETCQADHSCAAGSSVTCAAPSACFTNGTCVEIDGGTGGCVFTVSVGQGCSDSKACTTADRCESDGGCTGTPVTCDLPPGECFAATGTCSEALDGGCVYPVLTGLCDDGLACTTSDSCQADGGCRGTDVVCTPNECEQGGTCAEATGSCVFTPKTGQPCSVGVCNDQGDCVPSGDGGVADAGTTLDAGFAPSNFTVAQVPATSVNAVFTCNATLTVNDTSVTLSGDKNGCAVPNIPSVSLTQPTPPNFALLAMNSLVVNSGVTLRVVGTRPVIFAVLGDATINGIVDGSAVDSSRSGPGGNYDGFCATGRGTAGGSSNSPGGGGGGGAFGSVGGAGGAGNGPNGPAGLAGAPSGNDSLVPLRGGCAGANGGGFSAGALGRAGGALQFTAFHRLTINGRVAAGGSAGRGAFGFNAGGGGGGSGGGLLLEAPTVQLGSMSRLTANGGGGGAGATWVGGQSGSQGGTSGSPANGGLGQGCGGSGGQGAALLGPAGAGSPGGTDTSANCGSTVGGGGGGGGGAGRIRLNASTGCTIDSGAVISPSPTSANSSCVP